MGEPTIAVGYEVLAALNATLAARDEQNAELRAEIESLAAATFAGVREKQAARIATLEAELATIRPKAEAAERWFSVEERLPDHGGYVLALIGNEERAMALVLWAEMDEGWFDVDGNEVESVTHWRGLPPPPAACPEKVGAG